jgi:hypothetical protein
MVRFTDTVTATIVRNDPRSPVAAIPTNLPKTIELPRDGDISYAISPYEEEPQN